MPTRSTLWPKYSTNVRMQKVRHHLVSTVLKSLDRIAPSAAEALVKELFFRPRSRPISPDGQVLLDRAQAFWVKVNGQRVAAWQWGQGPAVLLVHGWASRGIRLGAFVQPLLDNGLSVIAFDGPGHGESVGRTSSYFEMIDSVSAFLDPAAGFGIVGIIGHSFGAGAVVRAVAGHPEARPAVALVAPSLKLQRLLAHTFHQYGIPRRVVDRIIARFERRFGYQFSADDPWLHLSGLPGPVAVVHDRQDRVVPFRDTQEVVNDLPLVSFRESSGLGHRRILFDPATVAWIVNQVCADLEIAGTPLSDTTEEAMMMGWDDTVARYRAASESDRLFLFLQYPELREVFTQVELADSKSIAVASATAGESLCRRLMGRVERCCHVGVRG